MGWEIGEDEGYDDGGVFVVRAGDVNGNSYISWPHEDLAEGMAEGMAEGRLNEFAPGAGDDGEEETLHKYARMWYNGDDATQQKVEAILDRMGWEIGELESEEGGCFVVRAGDDNGNSYIGFSPADLTEGVAEETCPHCSGPMFSELMMTEKKDACYYKVKSRYKVWPSAYASGALVKCRKRGAANWGNKVTESLVQELEENLHDWFGKEKWVRMDTKGNIKGDCAREPGEGKPKCLPAAKAHSLGKKGRASAAQRKRRQDPNPERSGAAINVATKKKSNEDYNKGMKMADYVAQADRLHDEMMRCQRANDQAGYERAKQQYLALERQARQGMVPEAGHNSEPEQHLDSELQNKQKFAMSHYSNYAHNPQAAFDKWVQRSLMHSEEDDEKNVAAIKQLQVKMAKLEKMIANNSRNTPSMQTVSAVAETAATMPPSPAAAAQAKAIVQAQLRDLGA
jgi:hypothetical protein